MFSLPFHFDLPYRFRCILNGLTWWSPRVSASWNVNEWEGDKSPSNELIEESQTADGSTLTPIVYQAEFQAWNSAKNFLLNFGAKNYEKKFQFLGFKLSRTECDRYCENNCLLVLFNCERL